MYESESSPVCVDIDECSNANICDTNADCRNELGGYSCRCQSGFTGNGYICESVPDFSTAQPDETQATTPNIPSLAPEHWLCDQCSDNAECLQGVCVCKNGWNGDGIECLYNCPAEYVWSVDRCVPITSDEEESK